MSFEDKTGHSYIVDIIFDAKKATKRQFTYNEIYPPIIEKQKTIDPCERSVFQLFEQFVMGYMGPKSYRSTVKAHATLFKKTFIPLYLEDFVFCIKRAGWVVPKIHSHLTFEQSRFKRNFILMNQKSRQKLKNNVEKDLYKLMNGSNFGYDCRNSIGNCQFVSIFDEYREVTYINRYHNIFDKKVSSFITPDMLKHKAEEEFNDKLMKLDKQDIFYEIKLQTIEADRKSSLESAKMFEKKKIKKEEHYMIMIREKTKCLKINRLKVKLILMKNILAVFDRLRFKKVQR